MDREVLMTIGLPCSGKSTWADENVPDGYVTISADEIKKTHPKYDPEDVTMEVHQFSVKEAEKQLFKAIEEYKNVFFDSGSINNKYSKNICSRIKTQYPEFAITLVWIKTPYTVCLERNALRDRKVPEYAITDKASIEVANVYKLAPYARDVLVVPYFKNKHAFFDMDGVLAVQTTLPIVNGEIDFVNGEVHRWQKPVEQMVDLVHDLDQELGYNVYILSASANSFCNEHKIEWLKKHMPWFDLRNVFFVNQGKHKAEMLDNLVRKFKLPKNEVVLIDDFHSTLYDVKARGMNAMHISEALMHNWYEDIL